ncbi:TetR/AcrR family transcriptional regulator [Actinocorallia populi]|uniref:TetR/AcrR family transcriptional regulator n=1 Tax=Actinocorallia populi TaxID=2079200 RepID=UPI000D095ED5|nr:TetR/AcrR family transcriptional regulator [Actinocorallia populi]
MTEPPAPRPRSGAQWARADATRQALLTAAREVFAERGYEAAGIAEIVERSGISVGSLYHHYGGKAGLYLALWEDHTAEQERRATRAVKRARADGVKDPIALFILGARAFLEVCWEQRHTSRLFAGGEGPAGFGLMRRRRVRLWIQQNTKLLGEQESGMLALILTTVMGEAGREVAVAESDAEAAALVDEVAAILARLAR